jgi:putative phage-type endonuclease
LFVIPKWQLKDVLDEIAERGEEHGQMHALSYRFDHWQGVHDRGDLHWLAERRGGIGGSDAAAAVCVSPYKHALGLWAEKAGLVEPEAPADAQAVRMGHLLEPVVLEAYRLEHPEAQCDLWPQHVIVYDDERTWLRCTPDAIGWDPSRRDWYLIQIKTARETAPRETPVHYEIQCQHEMMATGLDRCLLLTLYGGRDLTVVQLDADKAVQGWLLDVEAKLWQAVESKQRPTWAEEFGDPRQVADDMRRVYPWDDGEIVELDPLFAQISADLSAWKRQRKELDEQIEYAESRIKTAIGPHVAGSLPDGSGAWYWQTVERKGYTVQPSSYRKLSFQKAKGSK